jgi:2-methylcitrate dehydratase PrpD
MPFVAAVALREGTMGWDHYPRHLKDGDTLKLCQRIDVVVDPQVEAEFPAHMSGVARVRTRRGVFEKFVAVAKGEPENFVSIDELRGKFDGLVEPYLSKARRDAAATALLTLEQADDIGAVLRLTRPDRSAAPKAAAGND